MLKFFACFTHSIARAHPERRSNQPVGNDRTPGKRWWRGVNALGPALALTRMLPHLRVSRYVVEGWSMWPALRPGDRLLILTGAEKWRMPRRGDLVLARPSALDGRAVLKRVAAVQRDRAYRGAGRVMLLGDNLAASSDSRHFGTVALDEIHGRVLARYWPEARRGRVG